MRSPGREGVRLADRRGTISVPEIVTIVLAAVVAAVCGLVLAAALTNPPETRGGRSAPVYDYVKVFDDEFFRCQLAGEAASGICMIKMELKVKKEDAGTIKSLLKSGIESELKDWLSGYLSAKTRADLLETAKQNTLRREILEELNDMLRARDPEVQVEKILITDRQIG